MINRKVMSMCVSSDYCKGWNDAVKEIEDNRYVVFVNPIRNPKSNEDMSKYYPTTGTVGKVVKDDGEGYIVEWPNIGIWYTYYDNVIVLNFGKVD